MKTSYSNSTKFRSSNYIIRNGQDFKQYYDNSVRTGISVLSSLNIEYDNNSDGRGLKRERLYNVYA